jgi:short-subunit dehydrogenase involved in D-alanine esterification of teichoic acids
MPGDRSRMMRLQDFIVETMKNFELNPDANENCVQNVKFLREAEASGKYKQAFAVLIP